MHARMQSRRGHSLNRVTWVRTVTALVIPPSPMISVSSSLSAWAVAMSAASISFGSVNTQGVGRVGTL